MFKSKLEAWAMGLVREELKQDCEYCFWEAEQEERWERFKDTQPKAVVREHIEMLDLEGSMEERKGFRLFWLGVRLGLMAALGAASPED